MAFDDYSVKLATAAIDAMLANKEILHPAPAQFTRQGKTSKWFRPRHVVLAGDKTVYRAFTKPYRGARSASFSGMATSEGPVPMQIGYQELAITYNDMAGMRAGAKWNLMQELKHASAELAVKKIVSTLLSGAEEDMLEHINLSTFMPATSVLAQVDTIYDSDGTTWTGASGHAAAFIKIKAGQISRFQPNDVLDIYDTTDGTTFLTRFKVHDVIHGEDGPMASGVGVTGIGPGLVGEPCGVDGNVDATDGVANAYWDAVHEPAAGDFIARSGEYVAASAIAAGSSVSNTFHGIPDFFDSTVRIFRAGNDVAYGTGTTYSEIGGLMDREATGNQWMNPMEIIPSGASAGSEAEFDPEEQLMQLADTWTQQVRAGRAGRKSLNDGLKNGKEYAIEISDSLLLTMEPKLLNHLAQLMANKNQFMATAMVNEATAKRFQAIGVDGFEGYVWQNPTLGTVACQSDTNCPPHTVYIIEPSSFFWVEPVGGQGIQWLSDGGGSRIWGITGDTYKTPTFTQQAMAWCLLGLLNDQPRANAVIKHVCSAREAA